MKTRFLILITIAAAFMSSCSYKNRDVLFKPNARINPDSINPVYVTNNNPNELAPNIIAIDDILTITNLQNPDLISGSTTSTGGQSTLGFRVEADSCVSVPVLGKVNLVGLTTIQAEEKLNGLYRKEFLKAPIVKISISNMKVTVLGEVNSPGNYLLTRDKTNLIEILGEAKGLTPRANKGTVRIIRGDKKNPEIIYADLKNVTALGSPELNLRNNDIVYVEPNGSARAGDRLSRVSSLVQIGFVFVNTALLIYSLSK